MKKKLDLEDFLIGLAFLVIGLITFLRNVRISSFSFLDINGVNTGAVLIVLGIVALMAVIIKPNIITGLLLALIIITFIIVTILSVNVRLEHMSALSLGIIILSLFGGLALVIKALIGK